MEYVIFPDLFKECIWDPLELVSKQPSVIHMNIIDYSQVRKFGRDVLDINADLTLFKTGFMATIWNCPIYANRIQPKGYILYRDNENQEYSLCISCKVSTANPKWNAPCENPECIVRYVLDQ